MSRTMISHQMLLSGQKTGQSGRKSSSNSRKTNSTRQTGIAKSTKASQAAGAKAYAGYSRAQKEWQEPVLNQTPSVKYDVANGSSRVAQIMNEDPYLAESRNAAYGQGNAGVAGCLAEEKGNALYTGQADSSQNTSNPSAAALGRAQAAYGQAVTAKNTIDPAAELDAGIEAEEAAIEEEAEEKEEKTGGYTEEDLDNLDRMLERLKQKNSDKSDKSSKKKLNYNYKRVSSAISRSKNRVQASNALKSAKSVLSDLKRKMASQQYSDDELEIAVTHANKMIRAARRKVSHLKQEEMQATFDKDAGRNKEQKNKRIKQKAKPEQVDMQELDVKLNKDLQNLKKRLKQISNTEKTGHRRNENFELLEADMEYLKRKIEIMQQEQADSKQTTADGTGSEETTGTESSMDMATAVEMDNSSQIEATAGAEQTIREVSAGASVDVSL